MSTALTQGIRFFTRETGILSALAAACGTESRTETAMDGDCTSTSVFDLASVTKLFTGLCLMKLKEDGLLDFSRPVSFYDPRFTGLGDTPVRPYAENPVPAGRLRQPGGSAGGAVCRLPGG